MSIGVWWGGLLIAIALFQLVAIPALICKRNDFADVLWGPAFPLTAVATLLWATEGGWRSADFRTWLILGIVTIWAIRLFWHVGRRNLSHKTEDLRYQNWRKRWGKNQVVGSLLQVFLLQSIILYLFLLPVLLAITSESSELSLVAWAGLAVWFFGFAFESVADEQLRRFKSQVSNRGKLMTTGLWSWSRHPNYFGEVVQWWGIWALVVDLPWGWMTVISPIGVTFLILRVSGVNLLEELMQSRPGFSEYQSRTSIFIPRPPRKV
jgi:steroid 5-alpha reductase family enzyme